LCEFSQISGEDELALQRFTDIIMFDNNRYFLTWPWKTEDPDLPLNYELCVGRLKTLMHRLKQNPNLLDQYDEIIKDQVEQ